MPRATTVDALEWRVAYEAGATVEELALEHGRSPQTIRRRLHEAGTQMRPQGERCGHPTRKTRPQRSDGHLDPAARIVRPSVAKGFR